MDNITDGIKKAHDLNMIPAFAYARISSDVQDDGNSRENQEQNAKQYAEQNNLYIIQIFNVVESAKKEGRKVFNQMLDLSNFYGIRNLIFKSSDRMSRNFPDMTRIESIVDNQDFKIHFFQDHRVFTKESSHTDRMYLGIETTINKHWSDKISYDVKQANRYKALNGIAPCRAPFGYIYNKDLKRHEIDPQQEKAVRYIFDGFDTGNFSIEQFARHLNNKGIYTKTGKKWSKGNLYSLLTRVFYTGAFIYHGEEYTGTHEPYFSKHRYNERMRRLDSSFVGRGEKKPKYLLSKFLKCGTCDFMLTGDLKKGQFLYYKHKCTSQLKQTYIPEKKIFEMLDSAVRDMRYSTDFAERLKSLATEILEERSRSNKSRQKELSKRLDEIQDKKDQVLELLLKQDIDLQTLKRKMNALDDEMATLRDRRKLLDTDYSEIIYQVGQLINELRDRPVAFLNGSYEEKTEILGIMAEGVIIQEDTAQLQWKEPYRFLLKNDILEWKRQFEKGKKNAGSNKLEPAKLLPSKDSNCWPCD